MNGDREVVAGLRERFANGAEDKLGKALTDLLESPVVSGAIGRAFDAREKAAQAQELAMGALNLPSAADIERLTRRLRSFSQRLEGIEDGVARIDRGTSQRLGAIEDQLKTIAAKVEEMVAKPASTVASKTSAKPASARAASTKSAAKPASAKAPSTKSASRPTASKPTGTKTRRGGASAVEAKKGTTRKS